MESIREVNVQVDRVVDNLFQLMSHILNEEMTSAIIFGGALIILGVLINEIKPFSKKKEVL